MPRKSITEENSNIEVIKHTAIAKFGSFNKFSHELGKHPSNNIRDIREWFNKLNHILKPLGYESTIKRINHGG